MSKFLALIAAVAAVALVVAGCGGGDDTTSTGESDETLSMSAFLTKGNAVCAAGNKEIEEGFEKFADEENLKPNKEPTEAQFEKAAEDVLIPDVSRQIEGLRALGTPEGDEGELDEILTGAEEALEEIEEDPAKAGDEELFAEVNKEARAYGLTVCGEEEEEKG